MRMLARPFDHRGRQVYTGDVGGGLRERFHHQAWTACDVEHAVAYGRAGGLDQEIEDGSIANGRGLREWDSLLAELIEYACVMLVHARELTTFFGRLLHPVDFVERTRAQRALPFVAVTY